MSEYYHVVPWYNTAEWLQVYEEIYSPNATALNKQKALHLLLIWKARCPSLPSGVESTLTLLEVHIQDLNNSNNVVNEQLLRLAYSSAIMRFVNHMLDTETARGTSLYQAAKNLGVPDWIIDMRHDTAHSNNLPSIELLREATKISLDWLQVNYWEKHKVCMKDYISGQKDNDPSDEHRIATLINFCTSLSICAHSKCKIKNVSEIPDFSLRESIVSDARNLFGDSIDLSNLKKVSVMSIINVMNRHAKKLLKSKDTGSHVNKALLGEDSTFLSLELANFMCFYNKKQLSRSYVQCFEVLLNFLHVNNLLLDFILAIIYISESDQEEPKKRLLAALWVSQILKALLKSKQFIEKVQRNNSNDIFTKSKKEIKLLFHHWFPNQKDGLLLNLHTPIPQELLNINFVQPIISSYNPYLIHFIADILNLVDPCLPKVTIAKICKLAQLISSPAKFAITTSRIYTVDDLKASQTEAQVVADGSDDSDCCEMPVDTAAIGQIDHRPRSGKWELASSDQSWSTCPVGDLPWLQSKEL